MTENEPIDMELVEDDEPQTEELTFPKKNLFTRKLDPTWMPQIMDWAGQGFSLAKIVVKIKTTYGIEMSTSGLDSAIKKVKQQRSNQSKAVVRENVGTYIVNDLEGIKNTKVELFALKEDFKEKKDWKNYFLTVDKITSLSKMLFELSGVNENQVINEAENAKADLMEMFERFNVK